MHELPCGCRTCGFMCAEHAPDRKEGCANCSHFSSVFEALKKMRIPLDTNSGKRMMRLRENPSGDRPMTNLTMIESSDNRLYRVTPTNDPTLSHVWYGTEVRRLNGRFIDKKNARCTLVRKEATRVLTTIGEG